jgi:DNA modification methylase
LRPGCFLCINIGDAVRTLGGEFLLYPNHSRILSAAAKLGFRPLPPIIWYKPANSPTKFMGSGMLPAGAYVTLEHEYVLLLRNGPPRRFRSEAEKVRRRQSALFWEERNRWFANLWELRGTRQGMQEEEMRARSAAFPFELPFRLIQMYSLIGDTVLDPFLGVGTTMRAAAASARHSVGAEMVPEMAGEAEAQLLRRAEQDAARMPARLEAHFDFLREYRSRGKTPRHSHAEHGYPVISSQERDLRLLKTVQLKSEKEGSVTAVHREVEPQGHAEL